MLLQKCDIWFVPSRKSAQPLLVASTCFKIKRINIIYPPGCKTKDDHEVAVNSPSQGLNKKLPIYVL